MAIKKNTLSDNIDKVVAGAIKKYDDVMESAYVGKDMKVDGTLTRGQIQDNDRATTLKQENTKTCTCKLGVKVKRGSYIEIKEQDEDEYTLKGIVISIPNKTPVDYYFSTLIFNTTIKRYRQQIEYDQNGDIIGDSPEVIENIPAFVQRIGMRQRQVDVGIDRDSANQMITTQGWDIKKGDILYIGSDKYRINDIEELDKEIFSAYMTYYRD